MRRPITIISESARKATIATPVIEEESIVLEEQKIEEPIIVEPIIIEQPQTDEVTKQKKIKKS